jgi:predicted TIM-barrel fold metal-dependent hydrolase
MAKNGGKLSKNYAVFDCDAHINDPFDIWEKYVDARHQELAKQTYWVTKEQGVLDRKFRVVGGHEGAGNSVGGIVISGPGTNRKVIRKLRQMHQEKPFTPEQLQYLNFQGAYDAKARMKDMDLMGIDQVLVIPTMFCENMFRTENLEGANILAQAYNNFVSDWCSQGPDRLFGAGLIPLHSTVYAVKELDRIAKKGFRVALVRPIDGAPGYPNRIVAPPRGGGGPGANSFDPVYRTFEETGVVVGIHTFPAPAGGPWGGPKMYSPGELLTKSDTDSQAFSFVFEAMVWIGQVLLSGFLDRYPRLKMAIYESNSTWLPELLERCDKLFTLYKNERLQPARRPPSEAFYQQCMIAFEGDETPVFQQWDKFENIGIWSSDCYHHDGAPAWVAIREMDDLEVPEAVQAKLMGGNARRFYGVAEKFALKEELPVPVPSWWPKEDEALQQWWERETHPRKYNRAPASQSQPPGPRSSY